MKKKPIEQKLKRRRVGSSHRWTSDQTRQLLEAVRDEVAGNPEAFEKPGAQKFYTKVGEKAKSIASIKWNIMKGKMRYLKQTYMEALKWKGQTSAELLEKGEEERVTGNLVCLSCKRSLKICPHFALLEDIFGECKDANPSILIKSNNESWMEYVDESSISVEFPSSCNPLPSPDMASVETETTLKAERSKEGKRKEGQGEFAGLLLEIQQKRYALELQKFEWQKAKDEREIEFKKFELSQQMELKNLELERDERIAIARIKFECETEMKKYELELKFKNQNQQN